MEDRERQEPPKSELGAQELCNIGARCRSASSAAGCKAVLAEVELLGDQAISAVLQHHSSRLVP